jgi:hypothetical protein
MPMPIRFQHASSSGAFRGARFAVILAAVLAGGAAQAKPVWTSEDGDATLEVGGFYKTFAAGMLLPEGLVGSTEALAEVIGEAKQSLPASDAAALPAFEPLPREGALAAQVARVVARLLWSEWLDAEVAWQLAASLASDPAFAGGAMPGGSPLGSAALARRRLVDFDGELIGSGTLRLRHDLDRLSLKLSRPGIDLVVGRQVLGWGSGRLWNPTDLLSPFAPTDIDKEVRKGVDAVRVSVPLGTTGLLDALWLPQQRAADHGGVLRAQVNVLGYDLSLSAAKYVSDLVFGADFSGDAGPLGVHGEAAWTLAVAGWGDGPLKVEERFVRAVAGLEWRPLEKLVLMGEYYFNGFGAADARDYAAELRSDRVARGEVFGAGRHYLGLVSSWLASDLVTLTTTALVNLGDPSAMLVPVLEWSVEQSVLVRAGAFIPFGARADPSRARALGPADVVGGTPAFVDAISTLGLRSEYGAAAGGVLVQLAVYR